MQLTIDSLSVHYAGQTAPAVQDVSLSLPAGQIGVLLGPSGCGKTTLLRAVAGLETVSAGSIALAGEVISRPGYVVAPEQRRMGMVFQDYALFPHLDVGRNVAFGLQSLAKGERQKRVAEVLELVGLGGLEGRYPHELSGGQQQRVALARALAPRPQLLLLDEPFSNLDAGLRDRLAQELRDILRCHGTTALLVTHDQHEAFAMGDRIGVLYQGHLQQWADAATLYREPATAFVAQFIGQGMLVPALQDPSRSGWMQTPLGAISGPLAAGDSCLLLRAHEIVHDAQSPLQAELLHKAFRGSHWLYTLRLPTGETVLAEMPTDMTHAVGDRVALRAQPGQLVTFSDPVQKAA